MRLRLRRDAPPALGVPPEGWVDPRRSGRWTTLGNLDSPHRAAVDPAGLVAVAGATWSLDWWIGAEDRWHLPSREVAVRQSLVGSAPVVETRVRVPSGDAVHRVYAARSLSGDEAVVVEVENQTKVPFAVALAVRPFDLTGRGRVGEIALEGPRLAVDGEPALVLPRSPGRVALSTAERDSAALVLAGAAEVVRSCQVACDDGLANGALLFPLAHTATLRVVLPLAGSTSIVDPGQLPAAAEVARGWSRQVGRGARLEVPDRRLRDAVAASARHLLLAERTPAAIEGLGLLGFADEAAAGLREAGADGPPGRLLRAVGTHWVLTRDRDEARGFVELVARLISGLRATDRADAEAGHGALPDIADLLAAAGEHRAAADVARMAERGGRRRAGRPLADLLQDATGTWTWPGHGTGHDPAANAELVAAVRALLLIDDAAGIALAPSVPKAWLGQGWEGHDLPTRHGRLSFAVRWHGDRPALLWELQPHADAVVRVTAPGLDPAWATSAASGEALLAPVALPDVAPRRGITMPVSIEPLRRGP